MYVMLVAIVLALALDQLTVPPSRLPRGCALLRHEPRQGIGMPPPTQVPGIMANPWVGTDKVFIARIRQRMEGPPSVPDGPPMNRRAAARYLLQWAEGIEDGYAAAYAQPGAADVIVYAIRFAASATGRPASARMTAGRVVSRIEHGPIVAFVYGDGGECFRAVESHLRSLRP